MQNQDLQVGEAMLTFRAFLRKTGIALALIALAGIAVATVFTGAQFLLGVRQSDAMLQDMLRENVQYQAAHVRAGPPTLQAGTPQSAKTQSGVSQAVFSLRNPSSRWALTSAAYTITEGGTTLASGTTSLFPTATLYLVAPGGTSSAQLALSNVQWQRLLPDDPLYSVKLEVQGATYNVLSTVPGKLLSQVTGFVINHSLLTLPRVHITVLLKNGDTLVGSAQLTMDNVAGNSTRPLDVRIFDTPSVTSVSVIPSVDIVDVRESQ